METDYKLVTDDRFMGSPFIDRKFRATETLLIKESSKTAEEFDALFNKNFQMPVIITDLNKALSNLGLRKTFEDTINERLPPKQPDSFSYFKNISTCYVEKGIVLQTLAQSRQGYELPSLKARYDLDGYITCLNIQFNRYEELLKTLFEILRKPSGKGL